MPKRSLDQKKLGADVPTGGARGTFRAKVFRGALLLLVIGLISAQLALSAELSVQGGELSRLLVRKAELEEANQVLENRMATISSLEYLRQRAERELEMKSISNFEFIAPPQLATLSH